MARTEPYFPLLETLGMFQAPYPPADTRSYYGHYVPILSPPAAYQPLTKVDDVAESTIPLYHGPMHTFPLPLEISSDSSYTSSMLDLGFIGVPSSFELLPENSLGLPSPPSPAAQSIHSVSTSAIFSNPTTPELTRISSVESSPRPVETTTEHSLPSEPSRAAMKADPVAAARSIIPRQEAAALCEQLIREIIMSDWWFLNDPEPDRRVFFPYIKRHSSKSFECLICRKKIPRIDRAVDHIRVHMMHRPYACDGEEGCGEPNCASRFYTKDCLKSHCERRKLECNRCGTKVEDKNLKRHRATRKCRRTRPQY